MNLTFRMLVNIHFSFWRLARLTTIVWLKRPYLFRICSQH